VSVEHQLRFGVTTQNNSAAELDAVTSLTGEAPSIITFYQDWKQPVPVDQLTAIKNRGATPSVTWEPWQWGATDQSAYSLDNITAGNHDAYITQWAQGLKSYGSPVMLRFSHEMNGDWYPWAEGVNGNESGDYVAAWKHVHDIFAANGVTNVEWVWNPNVPYTGSTDMASLYPGAEYVDTVALDGYNWGTSQSWGSTWQSPSELFGEGLTQLRVIAPGKEILIAETASAEVGGDKAAWNAQLISYLDAQSDVTGFVWFDHNKEVDWRIASTTTSSDSFAAALNIRE
jgi:beta-mannanase